MAKAKTPKKVAKPKTTKSAKAPKAPPATKAKPASNGKTKKLSAIDAAAQILVSAKEAMTTKQLIEAMAAKGLWTSPGGKTPWATLYSAMLREINTMGKGARFKKTDRGHFASNQ